MQIIEQWSNENGVTPDYTAPYTSSQNGKAERTIQNTEQLMRALLTQAQLPITFWPYAVRTASYILKHTAVGPKINGKPTTPEEVWTKRKPDIGHMRVWGCKCYAHIPDAKRLSKSPLPSQLFSIPSCWYHPFHLLTCLLHIRDDLMTVVVLFYLRTRL